MNFYKFSFKSEAAWMLVFSLVPGAVSFLLLLILKIVGLI